MAIWVVKYPREVYRINQIFGQESTYTKEILYFVNRRRAKK